ncbi:hypothetical protein ACSS6W_003161 [Trichoderma asperelloides]
MAASGKPLFLFLVEGLLPLAGYDVISPKRKAKADPSALRWLSRYVPRNSL